jgi:hypothetical protein
MVGNTAHLFFSNFARTNIKPNIDLSRVGGYNLAAELLSQPNG